jgi:tetratricopeptide (TPR) repeat protein
LKGYFGILAQAEKSINKAIEKAEENLGRLFQLRSIIYCQLGHIQQSINDLSICINIEEKAEYFRDRGRMYQILGESEQAYEDLQKYI